MKYKISGDNLQLATVSLKVGDEVNAEAGAMIYKTGNVDISAVSKGFTSAIKRMLTRESLFLTQFKTKGGEGLVGFAGKVPGKIKEFKLKKGEYILAEKGAYLCSDTTVSIDLHIVKKLGAGLLGGEGVILQKLTGPGTVLIHAAGDLVEYKLLKGQTIDVDTSHLVAFDSTIDYSLKRVGGLKTMAFAKEGFFLAKMTGPGRVILQSMTKNQLRPPQPGRGRRTSGATFGGMLGGISRGMQE